MNSQESKAQELAGVACLNVFPVPPHSKGGYAGTNARKDATRNQEVISQMWAEHPDAWHGVPTGVNNIVVLDVDTKNGKDGFARLRERGLSIPQTFSYKTPSGGTHYVYHFPKSAKLGQWTNYDGMDGIDRQSGDSHVVWYGEVPWEDTEIAEAPSWLLTPRYTSEASTESTPYSGPLADWKSKLKPKGDGDFATQALIQEIRQTHHVGNDELLRFTYRLAVLAQEGHPTTADALKSLEAQYLLTSNESEAKREKELERLLRGAIGQAEALEAAGELAPWFLIPDWTPTAPGAAPEARTEELRVFTRSQLREIPKPVWLVNGLLRESTLAMLAGSGGIGKTYLCLYMAACVAAGSTMFGTHSVERGKVLYVGAEGIEGFDSRLAAIEDYYGIPTAKLEENMHFVEDGVNLSDVDANARLAKLVTENQYKLIVLDTFSQLAHVANENDAAQIAEVMRQAKRLRTLSPGSCVLFVHHAAKDTGLYRGSTALRDNIDTLISAYGKSKGFAISTDSEQSGKQRSGAPETVKGLEIVQHGDDSVVAWTGAALSTEKSDTWKKVQELLKDGKPRSVQQMADELEADYDTVVKATKQERATGGMLSEHHKDGRTVYWVLTWNPPKEQAG